jgi:hypothetical protein
MAHSYLLYLGFYSFWFGTLIIASLCFGYTVDPTIDGTLGDLKYKNGNISGDRASY